MFRKILESILNLFKIKSKKKAEVIRLEISEVLEFTEGSIRSRLGRLV